MVVFVCSQCGHIKQLPDQYGGKRARCPKCKAVSAIDKAPSKAEPVETQLDPEKDAIRGWGKSLLAEQPEAPPTAAKPDHHKTLQILSCTFLALLSGAAVFVVCSSKPQRPAPAPELSPWQPSAASLLAFRIVPLG